MQFTARHATLVCPLQPMVNVSQGAHPASIRDGNIFTFQRATIPETVSETPRHSSNPPASLRGPGVADMDSVNPHPLKATAAGGPVSHRSAAVVHKTFSTRAGALMLFSEDTADGRSLGFKGHGRRNEECCVTEDDNGALRTVEGLAWAALSYGGKVSHNSMSIIVLEYYCKERTVNKLLTYILGF